MIKITTTALFMVVLATSLSAADPTELAAAKESFQGLSRPTEAERQHYILGLAALRDKFAKAGRTSDWQSVDAEIRRHPAPPESDSKALSNILIGEWTSPRHEYVMRSNGTWSMLPAEPGTAHGRWRIEGNQYFNIAETDPPVTSRYTIMLLNAHHFIFSDQQHVFYETRIKR